MTHAVIVSTARFSDGSPVGAYELGNLTVLEYEFYTLRTYKISDITVVAEDWVPSNLRHYRTWQGNTIPEHLGSIIRAYPNGDLLLVDGASVFRGSHLDDILNCPVKAFITSRPAVNRKEPGVKILAASCGRVRDMGKSILTPGYPWDVWSGLAMLRSKAVKALTSFLNDIEYLDQELGNILGLFARSYPLYTYGFLGGWVRLEEGLNMEAALELARSWTPGVSS